jgi:cellulose synthase/poly-beta-1,6-N-acetylglucosamine synthase-like glycosyltransferase
LHPHDRLPYLAYTMRNYNASLMRQIEGKAGRLQKTALVAASMGILFPGGPQFTDGIGAAVFATKLSWLIPIPIFMIQAASTQLALNPDLLISTEALKERREEIARKRIIYTITTRGENLTTLRNSFDSVRYWLRKVKEDHGLKFRSEIWVVTEEDRFREERGFFEGMEGAGATLVVVPEGYETPNHSGFKARALQYACEVRLDRGIDTPDDWVYHQDTETMVGEDTVLGNLDFMDTDDGRLIGAGIILYPQDWKYRFNSVEETTRSVGDLGAMGQMKIWGVVPFGYHGSHLIVRADVENDIGWDFGRVRSEDLLFSLKLRERFGGVTRRLKGFAYEKPPFTIHDQLKQRRRWILGSMEVLARRDVKTKYKLPLVYSLGSWLSALPSITATVVGLLYPTGGVVPIIGGMVTGFMWWTIYSAYKVGLELHEVYVDRPEPHKRLKMLWGATLGMLFDAVAPWYAILRRTKKYEEIMKDDPATEEPLENVVVDVEPYAEDSGEEPKVGDGLHQPLPFKALNRRRF